MLNAVRQYIRERGYSCAEGLVESFYISLKTRPFVLLTGNSDVDKTALPRLFAEALGATAENGRYLQLPVSPDWMDSSDLFGWLDLEGKFIPGVIIDFLKAAQNDPEKPYFLCLDSLILSRADYFLRDYVAAVESVGQPEEKPFVNLLYYGRDEAAANTYGVIPALRNVYTVATVDVDLEGRPLSRKLLDRVETLTVRKDDMTAAAPGTPTAAAADNSFLETVYRGIDQCPETVLAAAIAAFGEINRLLTPANTYIGYKLRNDGILYLAHNRLTGAMTETAALDRVIREKILSRLQCTPRTAPVLEELRRYCGAAGCSGSAELLARMVARCGETGLSDYWDHL